MPIRTRLFAAMIAETAGWFAPRVLVSASGEADMTRLIDPKREISKSDACFPAIPMSASSSAARVSREFRDGPGGDAPECPQ